MPPRRVRRAGEGREDRLGRAGGEADPPIRTRSSTPPVSGATDSRIAPPSGAYFAAFPSRFSSTSSSRSGSASTGQGAQGGPRPAGGAGPVRRGGARLPGRPAPPDRAGGAGATAARCGGATGPADPRPGGSSRPAASAIAARPRACRSGDAWPRAWRRSSNSACPGYGERRAQLVGGNRQELVPRAERRLGRLVEAGVVEREGRPPAEVLRQREIGRAVAPRPRPGEREAPRMRPRACSGTTMPEVRPMARTRARWRGSRVIAGSAASAMSGR